MCEIKINNIKTISTAEGTTLFKALARNGIILPSACGGKGQCGLCRIEISHPSVDYTELELNHFSPEDRAKGLHLACQVAVNNNVAITVADDQLQAKTLKATASDIKNLTADIIELTISLSTPLVFKAGQFISFRIPAYGNAPFAQMRTYSIASSPYQPNLLRFVIRLVQNGYGSSYLHQQLKVGQNIMITGPYGSFYLRPTDHPIIMIAGGSGMAPMVAILEDLAATSSNRKINFYFGAKQEQELFYLEKMQQFKQKLANFTFIPCLTEPSDQWQGEKGLVPTIAINALQADEAGHTDAYLCGSRGMIKASTDGLKAKGVLPSNIFYDAF